MFELFLIALLPEAWPLAWPDFDESDGGWAD